MSSGPISRSPDLRRLADQGYELEVRAGHLLVSHVPYVTDQREVAFGTIVAQLNLANDVTAAPSTHVVMFAGAHPCDQAGARLRGLVNQSTRRELSPGLFIDHTFSSKPHPTGRYADYYEQITTYVDILGGPAESIDPSATAKTFKVVQPGEEGSPFLYMDTATSRAGIGAISAKLAVDRVAIVGLGGTGSYILDYLAKTPIGEIHLFDGDVFGQHNAFRAPGAAAGEELGASKVEHWASVYSKMRTGVIPHHGYLDGSSVDALDGMSFAFLSLDPGPGKRAVIAKLLAAGISFIDVGMGVAAEEGGIAGILAVSISTPERPLAGADLAEDGAGPDDYRSNVQVVELNALNAALAVIRWKKVVGFYRDLRGEVSSDYMLDTNNLANHAAA
jgi:hypothetical protein